MYVDGFGDLIERLADIWRYCTVDWLTIREPGSDRNRSRWPVKDYWLTVQGAISHFGQLYGVIRFKQKATRYDPLMRHIRGCLITAMALRGEMVGPYHAALQIRWTIEGWLKSEEFQAAVEERKGKFGNIVA